MSQSIQHGLEAGFVNFKLESKVHIMFSFQEQDQDLSRTKGYDDRSVTVTPLAQFEPMNTIEQPLANTTTHIGISIDTTDHVDGDKQKFGRRSKDIRLLQDDQHSVNPDLNFSQGFSFAL